MFLGGHVPADCMGRESLFIFVFARVSDVANFHSIYARACHLFTFPTSIPLLQPFPTAIPDSGGNVSLRGANVS